MSCGVIYRTARLADDVDDELLEENEKLVDSESVQSMETPIEINDPELDDYRRTMPSNWDADF